MNGVDAVDGLRTVDFRDSYFRTSVGLTTACTTSQP